MARSDRGRASVGQVFVGGGEMGELMRAADWAATPLGPVARWPQSLRSAVSILLPSKAQICLFWGPDFVALYNDAYRPAFGAKHPWALGRPARDCWREVWDVLKPLFEGVMQTGEAFWARDHPFYLERHGYPEETYFDVSYDPVRDETGGVGGIFCIVSETTGRVLGERRLRTLRELGAETTAKTDADVCTQAAAVLAQDPADVPYALFFVLDETGRRARLVELLGLARDAAVVAPAVDLLDGSPAAGILDPVVRQGHALEAAPDAFVRAVPATASRDRLLALPLHSGTQPVGVLVAGTSRHLALVDHYRDFFDLVAGRVSTAIARVRAYEEERRRAETLAALDRAKTAFFSNVSHEFRTPLTLLLGPLEDLIGDPDGPLAPADRQRVQVAHRNALRLLKLVNSLLDFSRIEAGRIQAVYEPTDLGLYTAELASAFRSLVERAGLQLTVDCPPGSGDAFVDRGLWEKVVFNLLSNAFKHTFEGEIRVALRETDASVALTVADTGVGIAADELPHVFERFHRIPSARARTHEGAGIGLALVAELVKLHGGRVDVQSQPDRGTTFTVSLPRGSRHLPPEHLGAPSTAASTALGAAPYVEDAELWLGDDLRVAAGADAAAPAAARPARILLADDNADMREYLRHLLGAHWVVEAVGDGAVALAAARARVPDLVLTDVMMPGLDGFELLRALRADARTRTVPVLLLSARAGEESRVEGLDAGADDYLVKPFAARELVARVRTHLELAEARRRFTAQLESERARLETVLRQMPAGVVIADAADGRFVLTNDQAERILGLALSAGRIDELPPERVQKDGRPYDREEWPIVRSLRTGETVSGEQLNVQRPDGTAVSLAVSSAPVCDASGCVIAAVAVFQDVTEELALVAREQAARAEADAANQAKDRFLAVLSHELRTPLNAILGWTRMLRRPELPPSDRGRALDVIERNALRQAELVNDLLDVSRIIAGKLEPERQRVDLAALVRDAAESIKADADAKRLDLAVEVGAGAGHVLGDPLRLQQVVLNLLTNAVKFTPERGRVRVRLTRRGGLLCLAVEDTGQGIDERLLPSIFEPFQQGDSTITRVHQGLGLGLTIVRQLVTLHGGTVRAESPGPGRGATFTIELPAAAGEAGREGAAPRGGRAGLVPSSPPRLDGLRLLVVDDQPDARELVTLVLRHHGAQTRAVSSVPEALAALEAGDVDVLLSDLAMPGADGYELIAAVRATERRRGSRRMRAIAFTAFASQDVGARALAAGFDAHATKPVDPEDLVRLIAAQRHP